MSKQANPTVIGGFVLGALALIVVAVLVFGSGALFRERVPMVTFFPGSVQGLGVGAAVQFEGVTVGRVTGIELNFTPDTGTFSVPVSYEIWPESVRIIGTESDQSPEEILRRLVKERGLHARLESSSFVTGQYLIALQLAPGRPLRLIEDPDNLIEVPALEATRDRLTEMLDNLRLDDLVNEASLTLASIRQLIMSGEIGSALEAAAGTLDTARQLLADVDREVAPIANRLDSTLADYGTLARTLEANVGPIAAELRVATEALTHVTRNLDAQMVPVASATRSALAQIETTMRSFGRVSDEALVTRSKLDRFLGDASAAAQSLRDLAEYLERHPEALFRGKQ